MANKRISDLDELTASQTGDYLLINRSGNSYKISAGNVAGISGNYVNPAQVSGLTTGQFYPLKTNPTGYIRSGDYILKDSSVITSLNWNSRTLFDGAGNASINWSPRYLKNVSGQVVLDWTNRWLYNNANIPGIFFGDSFLSDENGMTSVDYSANRYLYTPGGVASVDWRNCNLTDIFNNLTANWSSRFLTGGAWDIQDLKLGSTGISKIFYPRNNPSGYITGLSTGNFVTTSQISTSGGANVILKTDSNGSLFLSGGWALDPKNNVHAARFCLPSYAQIGWMESGNTDGNDVRAGFHYEPEHVGGGMLHIDSVGSIALVPGLNAQGDALIQFGQTNPTHEQIYIQYDGGAASGSANPSKRFQWRTNYGDGGGHFPWVESQAFNNTGNDIGLYFTTNNDVGDPIGNLKLSVRGFVESTQSGFKFPDGTIQSTAAVGLTPAITESTLTGNITITNSTNKLQMYIASGADRTITLPNYAITPGQEFLIKNIGTANNLIIVNSSGAYEATILPSWFSRLIARSTNWEFETQALNSTFISKYPSVQASGTGAYSILTVPSGLKYVAQFLDVQTTYVSGLITGASFSLGDDINKNKIISNFQLSNAATTDTYEQFSPKINASVISGGNIVTFTVNTGCGTLQLLNTFLHGYFI